VANEDGSLLADFTPEDRALRIQEGAGETQRTTIARLVLQ
jgi:hypothetical protein